MTKITERLARLNQLRGLAGKPAIKAWKESRVKLEAAIEKLESELPRPLIEVNELSRRKGDFAEWCRQNGFNPKTARAKLRKAGHRRNGSRYELNAAAVAIVKGE